MQQQSSPTSATKRIGFIGLGSMGSQMARNLCARGFRVKGFDVRADARAVLEENGGTWAGSVRDVASDCDFLLLMVVNVVQAEQILFQSGALDALPATATVVLMATCPAAEVERIATQVAAKGRRFVDAPVSGGVAGAASAGLTIMAACDADTFGLARSVLEAMGDKVHHVGERAGQGALVKTINQLLCGVHLAAAGEAVALGAKAGIDPRILIDILSQSSASSWMLRDRGARMVASEPKVTSAIDIFVKDLGIVLDAGLRLRAPTPLASVAQQMFLAVSGQGSGQIDDSQVVRAYRAMTAESGGSEP
ncbi:NAD(P)-dependent oxidoreductase [Bradyrhizobium sp. PRIMUS42]|uniref:NAD(P)-dependent oxidoreductase n=1 Tax=Bradyrhizobium sp. PRIMUS42 TaxID=2908926 RepID=UPI001FF6297E|nr:NAD(P)-dependent oxidoreductase [Bradyrhizobium sp. PRIMUS42]MCJ9728611.1 NAD(P)-dependent oxidoreductase [Bradyrhizobium sp. PRIMUS42]